MPGNGAADVGTAEGDLAGVLDAGELLGVVAAAGGAGGPVPGWRTAHAYPTVPTSADAARTPIVHDRTGPPPNHDTSQSLNAVRALAQHHHGDAPWHREELR
jgi:hypothetical protein